MKDLTLQSTVDLARFLMARFGTKIIVQEDVPTLRFAQKMMDLFGYDVSVTIGHDIYLRNAPGSDVLSDHSQSTIYHATVLVHEHQHVSQVDRLGLDRFMMAYLYSGKARATLEAESIRAENEFFWWYTAATFGVGIILQDSVGLSKYFLSEEDVDVANKYLASANAEIAKGIVRCQSAHAAIQYYGFYGAVPVEKEIPPTKVIVPPINSDDDVVDGHHDGSVPTGGVIDNSNRVIIVAALAAGALAALWVAFRKKEG